MIPIYNSDVENYTTSAIAALKSGWISNHGEWVEKATARLREITGSKWVILMNNGTTATHCLFLALKFRHPSISKIYVPNNVYIAAWNMCLAVYTRDQIQVMKMDEHTWNMRTDEEYIRTFEQNAAVLIVHNLGNIINVPRLKRLRPDLIFIEDNCEGFTGKYEGFYSGTQSLCSSVSFYGNKIITTGEGGAFFTNDDAVYHHIKKVYSQGMSDVRYVHEILAYNYRMTNIQAALLHDQLSDLNSILSRKATVFQRYRTLLQPLVDLRVVSHFKRDSDTEPANWIFAVRLIGNQFPIEQLNTIFRDSGVEIRPFFYPIQTHAHLREFDTGDSVSEILNQQVIMIPSSPRITREEQIQVVTAIYKWAFQCQGIVQVKNVVEELPHFIKDIDSEFFTYWQKRDISVLNNHVATVLLRTAEKPVAYGHLDKDGEMNWFGIYLDPLARGRKIGSLLTAYLLHLCWVHNIDEINLSVNRDNIIAQNLYHKFNFQLVKETPVNLFMRRKLPAL